MRYKAIYLIPCQILNLVIFQWTENMFLYSEKRRNEEKKIVKNNKCLDENKA